MLPRLTSLTAILAFTLSAAAKDDYKLGPDSTGRALRETPQCCPIFAIALH